ncbi:D-glycero-beta-D-manno-heptose 1,7-bisphosphate 7-phosphatase [Chloroflexota bacterium]
MTGIKQAVILAGGEGIRLRPLTNSIPKPMAPVNNRPFLEYLVNMLKENGITKVVMLIGYLSEKITGYFGDGSDFGININYSTGKVEDSTGTRLKNAGTLLDDTFLLMYGDNYWPLNLKRQLAFYQKHNTLASTTVYTNKDNRGEYGPENNIYLDTDGYVVRYDKSRKDKDLNGVDIGFFIINKQVLGLMPEADFSFEEEILPLLVEKRQLSGFRTEHRYYYISTLESLKVTENFLQTKKVILLDRDGVINQKRHKNDYIKNWSEFKFLPGAIDALVLLTQNGYDVYIITNQRGISRGLMNVENLEMIHQNMTAELKKNGAVVKGVYYCPHGLEDGCDCRKPKPGMLYQAASDKEFDLTKALFIGDSQSDLQAGDTAGCQTVLVEPGKNLLDIVTSLLQS